jgi:hypothetical protein
VRRPMNFSVTPTPCATDFGESSNVRADRRPDQGI